MLLTKEKKILIVEKDPLSGKHLQQLLIKEGYQSIKVIQNAQDAISVAISFKPDIILMEMILSHQIDGAQIAIKIHQHNATIPIVFITKEAKEEMIELAIDADAVAYLLKPLREREILATVELILAHNSHRLFKNDEPEKIPLNYGFYYNLKIHRLFRDNHEIALGKKSLRLIEILARNRNISVSNEQLCTFIWGEPKNLKTLRSLIHRLKEKLGIPLIKNTKGIGYKIA